jgi:hypothetical protein
MNDADLFRILNIIRGCEITDAAGLSPESAAVVMKSIILGAIRGLVSSGDAPPPTADEKIFMHPSVPHPLPPEKPLVQRKIIIQNATCRRGLKSADDSGAPFPHVRPPETGVCIFCGDGQREAPPEAVEPPIPEIRHETVGCSEHGSHKIEVRRDGSYDMPDCEAFRPNADSKV